MDNWQVEVQILPAHFGVNWRLESSYMPLLLNGLLLKKVNLFRVRPVLQGAPHHCASLLSADHCRPGESRARIPDRIQLGSVQLGLVRFGSVRLGSAWFSSARFNSAWFGSAWFGSVQLGVVQLGLVQFGSVQLGSVRFSLARFGV